MAPKKKVLFVCLGNTCRSPIVEAVFTKLVEESGQADKWDIDSAALEKWHAGDQPNYKAQEIMRKNHIFNYTNRARQIKAADFENSDFIFGMDEQNMMGLKRRAPKTSKAQLLLLGDFDPEGDRIIRDPYCDVDSLGFEKCYEQAMRCCKTFLEKNVPVTSYTL